MMVVGPKSDQGDLVPKGVLRARLWATFRFSCADVVCGAAVIVPDAILRIAPPMRVQWLCCGSGDSLGDGPVGRPRTTVRRGWALAARAHPNGTRCCERRGK